MGHFNKFNDDRGGHGFGGGQSNFGGHGGGRGGNNYSGRDDSQRPKFPAVCNKCGRPCEVPFRPTGDRPVFCSNCFKSQGGASGFASKFGGGQNRPQPASGNTITFTKGQFDLLISKLDKILSFLAPAKPAFVKTEQGIKTAKPEAGEVRIDKPGKKEKAVKKLKTKKK